MKHDTSAATYSTTASYTISHAGGTATVVLNQQSSGGQWRELGTYTFSPAAGHNVKLAAQANGVVVADAVKIVPLDQQASVFLIHADQIDTPRIVQDAQYNNRWAWDPDGFGQLPPNENPAGLGNVSFNLRMPGQYYDAESGLFYNHFRDYDPQIGRYVESDPIGLAAGINTYLYANANALSRIDPDGKFAFLVIPGLCAGGLCELLFGGTALWCMLNQSHGESSVPPEVGPGQNAGDSVPAGPGSTPTKEQQDKINEIGNRDGCHTCGEMDPGTKSGNWIGDHQDPKKLNPDGKPQRYYPQCLQCSNQQGGRVRWLPRP